MRTPQPVWDDADLIGLAIIFAAIVLLASMIGGCATRQSYYIMEGTYTNSVSGPYVRYYDPAALCPKGIPGCLVLHAEVE